MSHRRPTSVNRASGLTAIPPVGSGRLLGGTAWQIAADWWWLDKYRVRITGGKKLWETATIPERGNQKRVRLWRFENLKEHHRWIKPETQVELVPPNADLRQDADSAASNVK